MNKFKKLMQNGLKIYYKYFLFGSMLEECSGELCVDTETGKTEITKLAEWDYDKGNQILVHALALKRNKFPDEYTFIYC